MRFNFFKARKAQSATEYLMTYGWAILAIAIVGALLYTQVFSTKKCAEGANGFPMAGGVSIDGNQFTVDGATGDIQVKLRNNLDSDVAIQTLNGETITTATTIAANGADVVDADAAIAIGTTGNCYSAVTLTISYNVVDGVQGMTSSGTLSGRYA